MSNHISLRSISRNTIRPDMLAAFLGALGLIALIFVFQSTWIFIALILLITTGIAIWWGYDYIPLFVFLQLAFSVEMQITETTRLTVPTELAIPLLFLTFGFSVLHLGKIAYRYSLLNVMVFLLYFVMVASLRYSLEPISTIKAIIRDTGYVITGYYLIPRFVRSEIQLRQILIGCLGLHTLLVFYGFITQIIGGFHIYGNIAYPFFVEHCIYAAFISITFAFLLAFYLDIKSGVHRFWLGILTAIFGVAILLTFVRAAWISVFFLLIFYLIQFQKRKSSVDLILFLIVGTLLSIAVSFTTDVGSKILTRLDTITETRYTANLDRIDRWIAAWRMWGDHPYFGVGWGAYPDQYFIYEPYNRGLYREWITSVPYSASFRMGAHNLYLELLAEVGVVGLLVYLSMIYVFFRRALLLQLKIKNPFYHTFLIGTQGAMITYLIHAFVNNLGPSDKIGITFWFLLGMIPTLEALHRSEQKEG